MDKKNSGNRDGAAERRAARDGVTVSEAETLRYARFSVRSGPRRPEQSDEQYAVCLAEDAEYADVQSWYLAIFQLLCTHRGFAQDCLSRRCQRLRRCTGRHGEDDWSAPFKPFVPPCVPLYEDLVEEMRAEIRAELGRRSAAK